MTFILPNKDSFNMNRFLSSATLFLILFCYGILSAADTNKTKIESLSQKIKESPKNVSNYYLRAYEYKKLKQYEKAIQDFDMILKLYPKTKRAKRLKIHLLLITQQFKKTESYFSITDKKKDNNKNRKRLSEELIRIIQRYPVSEKPTVDYICNHLKSSFNLLNSWQQLQAVKAIEKLKQYSTAIELLIKMIQQKDPHHVYLGNLYTKNKQYDLALEALKRGIHRKPQEPFCQNHIAYQLLTYPNKKERRVKLALKIVIKASNDIKQSHEDIEDTLGLAYFLNGDTKRAILAQKRSLNIIEKKYKDRGNFHKINRSLKYVGIVKQLNTFKLALKKENKKEIK